MRIAACLLCLLVVAGCHPKARLRPPPDDRSGLVRLIEESDLVAVAQVTEAEQAVGFATATCQLKLLDTGLGQAKEAPLTVTFRPGRNDRPVEVGSQWMVFLREPAFADGPWRAAAGGVGVRVREAVLQTGEPVSRVLDLARQEARQRARFGEELRAPGATLRVTARWDDGDGGLVELGFDQSLLLTGSYQSRHRTSPVERALKLAPDTMPRLVAALATGFADRQRSDPTSPRDRDVYLVVTTGAGTQRMKRLPQPDLATVPALAQQLHDAALALGFPPPGFTR